MSMDSTTVLSNIDAKRNQLQEELQKQSTYLNELNSAFKKLRNDRKVVQSNISMITGAIQAYGESVRLLNPETSSASSETIGSQPGA